MRNNSSFENNMLDLSFLDFLEEKKDKEKEKIKIKEKTKNELKEMLNALQNDRRNPYSLDYWDEKKKNPFEWSVVLVAPKDSIYSGGFFKVKIVFQYNYPKQKPSFYFRTKIYHLNIDSKNGHVCCTMPKTNKIRDYLDAVFLMFYFENVKSPYQYQDIYIKDKYQYEKNAKDWVQKYALLDNYEEEKPEYFED